VHTKWLYHHVHFLSPPPLSPLRRSHPSPSRRYGGVNPDVGYLSDVWLLTISTSGSVSWQQLAVSDDSEAPVARDKHVLACLGGEVVMFGGFGLVDEEEEPSSSDASSDGDDSGSDSDVSDGDDEPAATFKWFDDLWQLRIDASAASCSWQRVAISNGPSCRAAPAYAVHGDVLYIFGGRLANGSATPRDNALWKLTHQADHSKWLWELLHAGDKDSSSTCPPGRSAASAACLQGGAFVVTGGTGNDSNALADVWTFAHGQWNAVTSSTYSAPAARSAACCVALPSNSLLVAFGSSGLDTATGISATFVPVPCPSHFFATAVHPSSRYHGDAWLGFVALKE
jgi:hypothetical protein